MSEPTPDERRIARLEARVAALEAALEERSRELRLIQRHVSPRDLVTVSRLLAGLPPLPQGAYEPAFWRETTELVQADVEETLIDLWRSVTPVARGGEPRQDPPPPSPGRRTAA